VIYIIARKILGEHPQNALAAAKWMNIPTGMISIGQPGADATQAHGQITDQSAVMFRDGRQLC